MVFVRTGKKPVRGINPAIMTCVFVSLLTMAAAGQSHTIKVLFNSDWSVIEKFEYNDGTSWIAVEDTSSLLVYVGNWNNDVCGTFSQRSSNSADSYCEFTFTGTGIRWYDEGTPNQKSDINIDGVFQQTVTTVAGSCSHMQYENTAVGTAAGVAGDGLTTAGGASALVFSRDPFGGSMLVRCALPAATSEAALTIHDPRGRLLWQQHRSIGPAGGIFTSRVNFRPAQGMVVMMVTAFDRNGRRTAAIARQVASLQ